MIELFAYIIDNTDFTHLKLDGDKRIQHDVKGLFLQ